MSKNKNALIIDNGSYETKAGIASKKKPEVVAPSVVAIERGVGKDEKPEILVGKDAIKKIRDKKKTKVFALRYPIQRGMIMDWEQMEHVWRYCFKSLNITEPLQQPVLLTAQPLTPEMHRESMAEMFFELFGAQQLFIEAPGVLSARAKAAALLPKEENGIVVDIGGGATSIIPIVKGKAQHKHILRYPLAGADITKNVVQLMQETGYILDPSEEYRIAQHVKQNMAYIAQDLNEELQGFKENPKNFQQELELPSGEKITLSKQCFLCCEGLFDPSLFGIVATGSTSTSAGIQQFIVDAISKSSATGGDVEKDMYRNIILSGQSTAIPGIAERTEKEIKNIIKTKVKKVSVRSVPEYGAWAGGADWCNTSDDIQWLTKQEYSEGGKSAVRKRFF